VEPARDDSCIASVRFFRHGTTLLVIALSVSAAGCGSTHAVTRQSPRPSSNPYLASLAYAKCLRGHGVPHPNPDRHGDFSLTPAQERKLRGVPAQKRDAAMKACFHHLEGLNMQPLSARARARAVKVLVQLKRCMHGFGYELGKPIVRNQSFGRALFGFDGPGVRPSARRAHAQSVCERRVDMARKISRIIAEDRRVRRPGPF
jgi:hypothetical protein